MVPKGRGVGALSRIPYRAITCQIHRCRYKQHGKNGAKTLSLSSIVRHNHHTLILRQFDWKYNTPQLK